MDGEDVPGRFEAESSIDTLACVGVLGVDAVGVTLLPGITDWRRSWRVGTAGALS